MTIRECYESVGSDFDDVLGRLGSENLIRRFAVKFLDDKTFEELENSMNAYGTYTERCLPESWIYSSWQSELRTDRSTAGIKKYKWM